MYSAEGLQELYNGEQGKTWDVDTNGKPFLTDEAWNYVNDINLELPEGGKWGDGIRLLDSTDFRWPLSILRHRNQSVINYGNPQRNMLLKIRPIYRKIGQVLLGISTRLIM